MFAFLFWFFFAKKLMTQAAPMADTLTPPMLPDFTLDEARVGDPAFWKSAAGMSAPGSSTWEPPKELLALQPSADS